jgi:hypothetical protein
MVFIFKLNQIWSRTNVVKQLLESIFYILFDSSFPLRRIIEVSTSCARMSFLPLFSKGRFIIRPPTIIAITENVTCLTLKLILKALSDCVMRDRFAV